MRTVVFPGVLRPPSDARLLATVMREHGLARGATVLDVFTGTGVLAIAAAKQGARSVTAIDIDRRAVLNTRLNARLNHARVRALCGDLFAPVDGERFDLIVANPPYLPGTSDELPSGGTARAWEGGVDGRLLVDRLCRESPSHLTSGGSLLIVHSSLCGEQATIECLARVGMRAGTLARQKGPLGRIVAARAAMLERRGLFEPGEREEEMLVIQGGLASA